jgi:hypothetical protein
LQLSLKCPPCRHAQYIIPYPGPPRLAAFRPSSLVGIYYFTPARQSQLHITVAPSDPRFAPIWPHASTRTPARCCITRFRNGDMHRWNGDMHRWQLNYANLQLWSSTPNTVQTEAPCASKELRSDRQVKPWYSHLKSSVVILPRSTHTHHKPYPWDTMLCPRSTFHFLSCASTLAV